MKNGAPGRIRTSDLVLRRHTLYPSELRARSDVRDADTVITRGNVAIRFYIAPRMRAKESARTRKRATA